MARHDSENLKTDRELIEEIAQRARRTETRVTKIAEHVGVDAGNEKPVLHGDRLNVPSRKTSLEDILAALGGRHKGVLVYCGDDFLATVQL